MEAGEAGAAFEAIGAFQERHELQKDILVGCNAGSGRQNERAHCSG